MSSLLGFRVAVLAALMVFGLPAVAGAQGRPYEPNDTRATAAGPLLGLTTYGAAIDDPPESDEGAGNSRNEDVDWYVFHTAGPSEVEVAFVFDSQRGDCFGPEVRLRDSAGRVIDRAHPFAGNLVHLRARSSAKATYYLEVAAYPIEPCSANESPYRLRVNPGRSLLVTPGGQIPLAPRAVSLGGRSSPRLRLSRARLERGVLRLRGTLAKGAPVRLIEGSAYGRIGKRAFSFGFKAKRAGAGRWTITRRMPRSLRRARRIRVLIGFGGDRRFRAVRLRTRTVRARR